MIPKRKKIFSKFPGPIIILAGFVIFAQIFAVGVLFLPTTALATLNGVVSYWKLDATAADSADGNNGTVYGATWTEGKVGSALNFDGDDYVNFGNNANLNIQNELTIEAWIKPDTVLKSYYHSSIVDKGTGYWFFILNTGKLAFLRFNKNDSPVIVNGQNYGRWSIFSTDAVIQTEKWTHVAVTYSASSIPNESAVKLYIDGDWWSGNFENGPIDSSTSALTIGNRMGLHYFDGGIDEVAVYSKALSAQEILDHYTLSNHHYGENDPPVATDQDVTTDEDVPVTITLPATDPESDLLIYLIVTDPSNGKLGSVSDNQVTYTPNPNFNGSDLFTFKAKDGKDDSNTATVLITIDAVNDPPVLVEIGNKTINEDQKLEFTISATDPDVGDILTYSATNLPLGAEFSATTTTFSWTPSFEQTGNYKDIEFTVSDGALQVSEKISIDVGNVNRTPNLNLIGNKSIKETEELSFTIFATDPDGDFLIYSASNLPDGARFENSTSTPTFFWTPSYDQAGNYSIIFKVCDIGTPGLCDEEQINIVVNNVNREPVLDPIGNKSVDENTELKFTISATDPDVNDILTYSATDLPNGASFDAKTKTFSWTPTFSQTGNNYSVIFSVCDNGVPSLCNEEIITIAVKNISTGGGGGGGGGIGYTVIPTPTPTPTSTPTPTPAPSLNETATGTVTATPNSGGKTTLAGPGFEVQIIIPSQAVSEDTVFTTAPAAPDTFNNPDSSTGLIKIGNHVYENSASANNIPVTTFSQPLTIIFTYTDAEVAGIDEGTLGIYWWDKTLGQWVGLDSQVDAANNKVTASVNHFTVFALMSHKPLAEVTAQPSPTPSPIISPSPVPSEEEGLIAEAINEETTEKILTVESTPRATPKVTPKATPKPSEEVESTIVQEEIFIPELSPAQENLISGELSLLGALAIASEEIFQSKLLSSIAFVLLILLCLLIGKGILKKNTQNKS